MAIPSRAAETARSNQEFGAVDPPAFPPRAQACRRPRPTSRFQHFSRIAPNLHPDFSHSAAGSASLRQPARPYATSVKGPLTVNTVTHEPDHAPVSD